MLEGFIVPRMKDMKKDVTNMDNYREVMIFNNISMIFEYCLLPYIDCVNLSCYQFGYRKNTSTLLAFSCLKENILTNIEGKDSMYSCFLGMSKAYENANHSILLNKLTAKGIIPFIVLL